MSHLLRGLLINRLSILNWSLLNRGSLLLSRGLTVAAATTHDTSDGLVSDFRASTHSHTSGEGTAETTAADATSDLGSSSGWGAVVVMVNLLGRSLLVVHCGSSGRSGSSGTETG